MKVIFKYYSGIKRKFIKKARLTGSWDKNGKYSDKWTICDMQPCHSYYSDQCFECEINFPQSEEGKNFKWGIFIDTETGSNQWGIATEINDHNHNDTYRTFKLAKSSTTNIQKEKYFLTDYYRLGANKFYYKNNPKPGIIFSVWAPNAKNVELVFGDNQTGYIADDGFGQKQTKYNMFKNRAGIWSTNPVLEDFNDFSKFINITYMFRITKDDGSIAYRTDLYARAQKGEGAFDPKGGHFTKSYKELAGTKSCSVVCDPDAVTVPGYKPFYTSAKDLVIYELHVGALGYGKDHAGNFDDTIKHLDYIEELGVNTIELLPINEFQGNTGWGYGTSHFFAIEQSAGGREKLKEFINECHKRKIAVILDVVYNHYHHDAERAEWAYDSNKHENNIYYWYEGLPKNYKIESGGYLDNISTGYAPRYHDETVRKMFISSAVMFIEEFNIDGFRLDQTTSIHSYNALHENGNSLGVANMFGAKFLREFTRTIRTINKNTILIAEDHSDWDNVTKNVFDGGLGFDAVWYADFYHHLIGDQKKGSEYAKLLEIAGTGTNSSLAMDYFAGVLGNTGNKKVVYNESHDEAGNAEESARTILVAVNDASLTGDTRKYAEARCRFVAGMTLLSAGTPMFFMGEEVGAQKSYTHNTFINHREDLYGLKKTSGKNLFNFHKELINLRNKRLCLQSNNIEILYTDNYNRVIAFRRWNQNENIVIAASLNNSPFKDGYYLNFAHGKWKEIFNSDSAFFGGNNIGNYGAVINASNGYANIILPANGFVVFEQN